MKPFLINIIAIGVVIAIILFSPAVVKKQLLGLIVLGTAVWSYFDARKLEIQKYEPSFLSVSKTPLSTAFGIAIIWIIAFPIYIIHRQRIIDGKIPLLENKS